MPKSFNKFWNLASAPTDSGVLNMYVYGAIVSSKGWFSDESDVVTSAFIKDLQRYPNVKNIRVYINSPGGEVFAAVAIMNQLKAHPAVVDTYIDGIAASAATIIAEAADPGHVHMSRSALMMIHNPATRVEGDVSVLQKSIEVLNKVKDIIVSTYKAKTNMTDEELSQWMDSTKWLKADEAKAAGFVDDITEDGSAELVMDDTDDDTFVYNGVSMCFSNFLDAEQLKQKLNSLHPTIINHKQEGANVIMDFTTLMNSLPADQQKLITDHITAAINSALAAKQVVWDSEKKIMQDNLEAANAKIKDLEHPTAADNSEDAILNSLPEAAKKIVLDARRAAAEAQAKLDQAAKDKAFTEFTNSIKTTYGNLPLTEDNLKDLFTLSNVATKEQFESVTNMMKIANAAIMQTMNPAGSDNGLPQATNATEEIENLVKVKMSKDVNLSYTDALHQVCIERPDLYENYRNRV
jgi:ATP-dependent protease ClpP protease subunit